MIIMIVIVIMIIMIIYDYDYCYHLTEPVCWCSQFRTND